MVAILSRCRRRLERLPFLRHKKQGQKERNKYRNILKQRRTVNREKKTKTNQTMILPDLKNDEGAVVNFGDALQVCSMTLYCDRPLGVEAIPGSDGRCGPNNGPACPSCRRLSAEPSTRVEVLRRLFPGVTSEEEEGDNDHGFLIRQLRANRGNVGAVVNQIENAGAQMVPKKIALSAVAKRQIHATLTEQQAVEVARVVEFTGATRDIVEYAMRRLAYRTEEATEWILEHRDTVEAEVKTEQRDEMSWGKRFEENQERKTNILQITEANKGINISPPKDNMFVASPTGNNSSQLVITTEGHRMKCVPFQKQNNTTTCVLCASTLPSRHGGSYQCQSCLLCEGCVSTLAIPVCPGLANGGHLHHHSLHFTTERNGYECDIKGCNGESCSWSCNECNFYLCMDCIEKEAPKGYNRRGNAIEEEDEGELPLTGLFSLMEEETEDDANEESLAGSGENEPFQEETIVADANEKQEAETWCQPKPLDEKTVNNELRLRWGYEQEDQGGQREIFLGYGSINYFLVLPVPQQSAFQSTDTTLPIAQGKLSNEAKKLFDQYLHMAPQVPRLAAADVVRVEGLLRIAQAKERRFLNETIRNVISSGHFGVAGSLLVADAYAPQSMDTRTPQTSRCWCGDVIDNETSPDGAVGCSRGHAMHPACAADLLLGGSPCPTCREPLFLPMIEASEAMEANKFVQNEINRAREEEKERVRTELEGVGDDVIVSSDKHLCSRIQSEDPISGGWNKDMLPACGREGRITRIVQEEGKVVSVRVRSLGKHSLSRIHFVDDYICRRCNKGGPSSDTGQRKCVYCGECEHCCFMVSSACCNNTYEFFWNPSLLTLVRQAGKLGLVHDEIFESMELKEAAASEKLLLRLRGELAAVKAAREVTEVEMSNICSLTSKTHRRSHSLTEDSHNALFQASSSKSLSRFECQRAHHLLLLAQQWDVKKEAKEKHATVVNAVQEGDLDLAARLIRRYNASKAADAALWNQALQKTSEYVVNRGVKVNLRAYPSNSAPMTGYALSAGDRFSSKHELLDRDGNTWLQIATGASHESSEVGSSPQGWMCLRPGGLCTPKLVSNEKPALICAACKEELCPRNSRARFCSTTGKKISRGDRLFVAATLEPVVVEAVHDEGCFCSFPRGDWVGETFSETGKFFYEKENLVLPNHDSIQEDGGAVLVKGQLQTRRDLVLMFGGNESAARAAWEEAKHAMETSGGEAYDMKFASCTKGHLLHARCFQQAILGGKCCPAPGCKEPLWVPSITGRQRDTNDDPQCTGRTRREELEDEALRAVSELSGQVASLASRSSDELSTVEGILSLKMCPLCCSGPIFNNNCSDMEAHHGQCSTIALQGKDCDRSCTPEGEFRVSKSDIAKKIAQVSPSRSVADVLPKCPTHNVVVMFNGCMGCGHIFADTCWTQLPDWEPNAQAKLDLEKKRRKATQLLANQVRSDAALLQFERDALDKASRVEVD